MPASIVIENCDALNFERNKEIHSIVIEDGVIASLSESEKQSAPSGAIRIDAGGASVLPGLIDTHCHLIHVGATRRNVGLKESTNITSVRMRLSSRTQRAEEGEWIIGEGWDQEKMSERRLIHRDDIDDITRKNPAILLRVCGHIALLNTRALAELGINDATPDPPGGSYERDEDGRLTGIVKETALERVLKRVPSSTVDEVEDNLLNGEYEAAKNGLTTIHCMLSANYVRELEAIRRLKRAGNLALRYRVFVPVEGIEEIEAASAPETMVASETLKLCGVKIFADGSLGARTAALTNSYTDRPSNKGILRYEDEELERLVSMADSSCCQVAVHAIGDRAIAQVVRCFEKVAGSANERRHRIEHCSLTTEDLLLRILASNISVTVQPHFVISDAWVEQRLGFDRLSALYAFKSLLKKQIKVSGSSDAPVEPLSPILGIWAALVRSGYAEEQKLSLQEALQLYTVNAAYNGFDEGKLGEIREGFRADLTVLDSNIRDMHPAMLRRVGVAETIVDGKVAFSYEGLS